MPRATATASAEVAGAAPMKTWVLTGKIPVSANVFESATTVHMASSAIKEAEKLIGEAIGNEDFKFESEMVTPRKPTGPRKKKTPPTPTEAEVAAAAAAEAEAAAAAAAGAADNSGQQAAA